VGIPLGTRVPMTAMPQRIAIALTFGASAATLVGIAEYHDHRETLAVGQRVAVAFEVMLGSLTVAGSFVAAGKLQEVLPSKPLTYRGQNAANFGLMAVMLVILGAVVAGKGGMPMFYALVALAFIAGISLVLPIGGADMPVVVALLNSYSAYHVGIPNLTPKLPWAPKDFVPVALITVAMPPITMPTTSAGRIHRSMSRGAKSSATAPTMTAISNPTQSASTDAVFSMPPSPVQSGRPMLRLSTHVNTNTTLARMPMRIHVRVGRATTATPNAIWNQPTTANASPVRNASCACCGTITRWMTPAANDSAASIHRMPGLGSKSALRFTADPVT